MCFYVISKNNGCLITLLIMNVSYRRYVDDTFFLFPSELHATKFLKYMNSKHRNIKFTFKREESDSLSFLNIKIFLDSGKFQTSVYRKSTFKHWNIKFTVKWEESNSLSFLNIKIFLDGGKFQTSVYRKSTFSDVLTNFESFLPIWYKYNLVSTLLHRGFMIYSFYRTLDFEILNLKQIFRSNGYPKNLVYYSIKMYLHKVFI